MGVGASGGRSVRSWIWIAFEIARIGKLAEEARIWHDESVSVYILERCRYRCCGSWLHHLVNVTLKDFQLRVCFPFTSSHSLFSCHATDVSMHPYRNSSNRRIEETTIWKPYWTRKTTAGRVILMKIDPGGFVWQQTRASRLTTALRAPSDEWRNRIRWKCSWVSLREQIGFSGSKTSK